MEHSRQASVALPEAQPGDLEKMMRWTVLAALAASLAVSACDRPESEDEGLQPMPAPETTPPPVEPQPLPQPEAQPQTPPPSSDALPDDKRSSEETVQPQSETLFY